MPIILSFIICIIDYAPSIITDGNTTDIRWCGKGPLSIDTDVIYHRTSSSNGFGPIEVALRPTAGAWNQCYVCVTSVVKGAFRNPSDGQSYNYAMYCAGVGNIEGNNNSVGPPFSNDKVHWVNYPRPVIDSLNIQIAGGTYGPGHPSTFSSNVKSRVFVFYTDLTGPQGVTGYGDLYVRHTNDGINFGDPIRVPNVTTNGQAFNANLDFGYDDSTGYVYGIGSLPGRDCSRGSACAGGTATKDRDTDQLTLGRMPVHQILGGSGGQWEAPGELNADQSGFYQTHSPKFQRDPYGNISSNLPNIDVFFSGGNYDPGTGI